MIPSDSSKVVWISCFLVYLRAAYFHWIKGMTIHIVCLFDHLACKKVPDHFQNPSMCHPDFFCLSSSGYME